MGEHGQPAAPRGTRMASRRQIVLIAVAFVAGMPLLWALVTGIVLVRALEDSNQRLGAPARRAIAAAAGTSETGVTTILLLGSDARAADDAATSDSIMLVRVDTRHDRLALLSVPRDLLVDVPGFGPDKLNAALQAGGVALSIRTVRKLTGLPVDHVVLVDFRGFRRIVDSVGGVTVDNPYAIVSSNFDGHRWRFGPGRLHLDGERALAYARVRRNTLRSRESDSDRARRQQQIVRSLVDRLVSMRALATAARVGPEALRPVQTDIAPRELVSLALAMRNVDRDRVVRCRLGGSIEFIAGNLAPPGMDFDPGGGPAGTLTPNFPGLYLVGSARNVDVLRRFASAGRAKGSAPRGEQFPAYCTS